MDEPKRSVESLDIYGWIPYQFHGSSLVAVVKGDDGLEQPQPEDEVGLVVGRPLEAVQPLEIGAVALGESLFALEQTLLGVRKLGHVAQFEVAPRDVQVEEAWSRRSY